ncbi:major facilitator superfamily domain-containing protein [Favolaschia claudopus]|uniref:Major facilitator superfamily domain-containing protein n=1 Tax=Favolaschia claudopus TaxID=2862362 RepID=A0AAW0C687_9AGAR
MSSIEEKTDNLPSLENEKKGDSQLEIARVHSADDVDFGGESTLPPPPTLSTEQERKLWRKVDLRLMPILSLMYLLSFLDRGNIGNARLDGLQDQLNLGGNKYNIALTMFFVPYCLFECPANLVLKRFRPSRWLPGITVRPSLAVVWGTVMYVVGASNLLFDGADVGVSFRTLMGLVKTYPQLVGVRVCLGVAEAGLFPLSLWYPRHMLQWRIGIFFGAASMAGAFSGLLAFGINFMSGTHGLLGWSWIFILEGIATVAVGLVAFLILVDFPATATFLTPEERSYIVFRKKYDNSSVGEEEHFAMRHLIAALTDWQVWLHILIYMSIIGPLYGITLFLPFGHNVPISQLLTVPPYRNLIRTNYQAIVLFIFAYWSDKIKKRAPFIYAGLTMLLIGFSINISNAPSGVKYFGTFFCVAGSYAAFPGVVAWLGNNLSGQYKRGVGMALHIGIGNFSGAIASNIYRTQDKPRFIVGHGCELMFVGIGIICVPIAVITYTRINKRRDEIARGMLERGEKMLASPSADSEPLDFGGLSSLPPPPTLTTEEERKLYRKIDLRLMPILSLFYLVSFLDRGNARLQGLETQLDLTGNKFNIALTMFFIPYCIFECPAKWLPGITVVWGIIMTLMGLVKTYPQLVGVRVCLGIAEAGLFPLTLWYPRHMLQWRVGLFFGAASLAGAFSGALAFGISFMSGTRGLLGWSWIFILEGIATVVVGIIGFFVLVDFPATAEFLTPEQRAFVVWRKKYDNSSVGEEEHFEMRHLVEALTDWQVWLHMLVYMSIITNLYGITLFLPFGHSAAVSQLLTVPPYVNFAYGSALPAIVLFIFAYSSDRLKLRFPFILAGFTCNLIGFSINISNAPSGVKYFGTFFCVTGAYAAVPGIVAWLGNNLSGQYKRGVGMAFQIGIGHFGGAFASNMYRTQDKPRFLVGHGCELMFVAIGLLSTMATAWISHRVNRRRDEAARTVVERGEDKLYTDKALRAMGDRAPDFRYML